MDTFAYNNDRLMVEQVSLDEIAAAVGTPFYVYSRAMIEYQWRAYDDAFSGRDHLVCYAVKANSNIALLRMLAQLGSGFDLVSGGELERVIRAGGDPDKIVFSGVGKTEAEIRRALELDIGCFNVESASELVRINEIARDMNTHARIALRVNPDVDPNTHPYISTGLRENKFGIPIEDAFELYQRAAESAGLQIKGIACHIGSQLTDTEPFIEALERVMALVGELDDAGITLETIDLGGGLGITYYDEEPPEPDDYITELMDHFQSLGSRYQKMCIIIEPGRSIVGNAGALVSRVEYLKHGEEHNFAVIDAAMNDLIRPTLYNAWQEIVPVERKHDLQTGVYDVVGPICETGDFLGKERELAIEEDDLVAILSAGAYGFSMSSNYNSRPRVPEVMVDGDRFHVIRRRETLDELIGPEAFIPE
ncbi:MAG: diaminopimelate decarboxylase [Gammaproteobacteria bacterium]|nr:diaminopimelate decarboxylase [Gammaproteobacteria bacterium]